MPAQSGVYGIGWSLAASCSAGMAQPDTASCAVPASANPVAAAATPAASRATPATHSQRPVRLTPARSPRYATRKNGASVSRPSSATVIPPMNMTCVIATSGATW